MTTTAAAAAVIDHTRAVRLVLGRAALAGLVMIGFVGCAGSDPVDQGASLSLEPTASTTSPPPASTTTVATPTTVTAMPAPSAAPTAPTPAPIDAAALLTTALDGLAAGYHFTTTVTLDGVVALVADGDRVGDGTRVTVGRDGVVVFYVITPEGTWVQPEGGDWEQLDTPAATTDPIGALRSPTEVTVAANDGTTTTLAVTVPAANLGVALDGVVVVSPTIVGGVLTQVDYSSTIEGSPATVQAIVGPVADSSPVVNPI